MAWPKKTWVDGEWVDFNPPSIKAPKGFPDDWKKYKSSVDNSSYWDILDNPLYEAAANAKGLNWEEWKAESLAEIGMKGDYEDFRERVFKDYKVDEKWASMSKAQQQIAKDLPEFRMADRYDRDDDDGDSTKYKDDRYDWGIDRGKFGAIAEDLDDMHAWLGKTIKTHSLQDSDIITHGLDGSDYGIDGDLWAHYGLDKPPKPPTPMDLNYEFNLLEAKPSTVTYATPEGFPVLDTSTESVAYEDTYYAKWQRQKGQEQRAAEHAHDHTSYGETISSSTDGMSKKQKNRRRWTRNVKEIIGKDQDHNAWAEVAGVTDITSRNDSDLIKKAFRDHDGVLPT